MPHKVKVIGFGEPFTLKLNKFADAKSLRDQLGLSTQHVKCGGSIGMRMFCKECDEDAPATEWITENGIVVHRQEVEGGVFEAVAATYNDSRRDYLLGATDTTYTCEAEKRSDISEALAWAFTKSDLAVLGYLRLQKNSDERPAVLYCADGGVLVLQTLFYHEDEVQSHTPYFEYTAESEALSNAYLETLTQLDVLYPEALKHRELKEIQKQITKATAEKGVKSVGE